MDPVGAEVAHGGEGDNQSIRAVILPAHISCYHLIAQSPQKPFWVTWCLAEASVWLRDILTLMKFFKRIEASVPSWFPCRSPGFSSSGKAYFFFYVWNFPPSFWKGRLFKPPSLAALQIISQTPEVAKTSLPYKTGIGSACQRSPLPTPGDVHRLFTHQQLRTYSVCQWDLGHVVWCSF